MHRKFCCALRNYWPRKRVDDVKVEKELMGCHLWGLAVTMAWVAKMASMASMVWTTLWRRWRRWLRWIGVDRRWWTGVFDTEGTDVEAPLCPQ